MVHMTSKIIRSSEVTNQHGTSASFTLVEYIDPSGDSIYQVTRIIYKYGFYPSIFNRECSTLESALNVFHNLQISYLA